MTFFKTRMIGWATLTGLLLANLVALPPTWADSAAVSSAAPVTATATPAVHANSQTAKSATPWYAQQTVKWKVCSDNVMMLCGSIEVPLNWAKPNGERIKLALSLLPAAKQPAQSGALVVNPGGPGASGIELAAIMPFIATNRLLKAYDVVGFDPRGVGKSTPLRCVKTTAQQDQLFDVGTSTTQAGRKAAIKAYKNLIARCKKLSGNILRYMDSMSAARDMDVIRASLKQPKLNYLGFSYGTKLGAYYAELFPKQVGRMVL
ncbi:MAG: alpha/beta hydrolase, partial [Bifidobacteriaceae bacterium]|nr:alpha/beta hydrolase [Bifidobacteriaceae bacterium]